MSKNFIKVDKWGTCLWGIDDAGKLFINAGAAGDLAGAGVPWDDYRGLITEAEAIGDVEFPEGASLAELFRGCKSLEKADLSGFHTEGVVSMRSMFDGCSRLRELDLSSFDTTGCRDMTRMFARCARLTDILIGDKFSITGDGTTSTDRLAIKEAGKYKRARVIAAEGAIVSYHENAGRDIVEEKKTVPDFRYVIEEPMFSSPGERFVFIGWNPKADGSGRMIQPGMEIRSVDEDIDLYAIWASAPEIGEVSEIPEFAFGEPVPFKLPEIVSANDNMVRGYLEVSPDGENGTWRAIDHNTVLPVSCDGWLIRLCASNRVGKTYSQPVTLHIRKADIDLSQVRWTEESNMTYDGTPKHVWVEGIPSGLGVEYHGNEAIPAGNYTASMDVYYDADNYNEPQMVREHEWTIRKAVYDMSRVRWDYTEAFTYDGTARRVELTGLPEGITVTYHNNEGINAGVYTATVDFEYDEDNYERPAEVIPCVWEIRRAMIEPADLTWSGCEGFVYDGEPKSVWITNLPEDAEIVYDGAEETTAGKYLARAALTGNYCSHGPLEYEWEIGKSSYDMSAVSWDYSGAFVYDKELHTVALTGVPEELGVRYRGNTGTYSGNYTAEAYFVNPDTRNYYTPHDMMLNWVILKEMADMSEVRWNYEEPFTYDGELKKVELIGLPEGIYAEYENAGAFNAGVYNAHAVLKYDSDNMVAAQPADCRWIINKDRIDTSEVRWDYENAFTYDGAEHGVYLTGLPEGVTAEYTGNTAVSAGRYAASAALIAADPDNYDVPEISGCTWEINRADIVLSNIRWTDFSDYVYDGGEKTVEIISDIDEGLNVEYVYNKQTAAGSYFAKAIFTAVDPDNYRAPAPAGCYWKIRRAGYDLSGVSWDYEGPMTYTGEAQTVALTGVPEGLKVSYTNASASDAGRYTAVASFSADDGHNFDDNIPDMTLDWEIGRAGFDMSEVRWQEERSFAYDGTEKEIRLVGLPEGLEAWYTGNRGTDAGEYVASAELSFDSRNFEKPEIHDCRWSIERAAVDLSAVVWDYSEPFTYDGREKSVVLAGIPEGAYAEYNNATAVQAGTYVATASILSEDGNNYLPGKADSLTWRIEKGEYDLSNVYWDYEAPFTYDGTEHKVVLKGLPEGLVPTYRNNTAAAAGTYLATVTFRASDERNYRIPAFENCEWTIRRADYDMSKTHWNYSGEFTYDGRMHEVVLLGLPDGVRAVYSGNAQASAGSYEATADLIPYDADNFNKPFVDKCSWQIVKADIDMSGVRWDHDADLVFNGRSQSVLLENLPNGVYADYSGNEAVNAGNYMAKAVLRVSDPANYNVPAVSDCEWEIGRADYDLSGASWNYEPGSIVYDGGRKSVEISDLPADLAVSYDGNTGVQAGDYVATATFSTENLNFRAPEAVSFPWSIGKADADMSSAYWDYSSEFTYDGTSKRVEVRGLPAYVTAEYEQNTAVDAGAYSAAAHFSVDTSNYNVPEDMACEWVIRKADPDIRRVRWDYSQALVYDRDEKRVTLAGLPDSVNAVYSGNAGTEAGRYTAHADLVPVNESNYNTPQIEDFEWEITRGDYDMSDVRWEGDFDRIYDGTEKRVWLAGLPDGIEARYTGNAAVSAGIYTASAELVYDEKNYNAPSVPACEWTIAKATYDMSGAAWTGREGIVYDGEEKSVVLTGLPEGVSAEYSGNTGTNAGEYAAHAVFSYDEQNYEAPTFSDCRWEIEKASIPVDGSNIKWNYSEPFIYDGTPKRVSIIEHEIPLGFFDRLRGRKAELELVGVPEGFEVMYENNEATDAGVYYAAALLYRPGDDNYKPYKAAECRWEIRRAKIDASAAEWNYDGPFIYDGTEKSVELAGLPENVRATYYNNRATAAGEYEAYAVLEAADPVNYEHPVPVKGCWWEIRKAEYDLSGAEWTYYEPFMYDGTEHTVTVTGLPDGVTAAAYKGNKAVSAGSYTAEAVLDYVNKDNYEKPEMPSLRWSVLRRKIETGEIRWNYDESSLFVYDGQPKEVRLTGVPEGVEVVYIDNCKVGAGTYTARAQLVYDAANCEVQEVPDLEWKIEKASYDTSHVYWSYDRPFLYDAYEKSVVLRNVPKSIEVRYRDNKATEIGTYTAKAYLTYDSANYNEPEIDWTVDWEIIPRSRD